MHGTLPRRGVNATSNPPKETSGTEENFPLFGQCARLAWPVKTAFSLAEIGGVSDRAAQDWLSGKVPPPAHVVLALMAQIIKR